MYASTPMTRVATLDQSSRLAALRVLGVTFAALVLLAALVLAAMPRPASAASIQAAPVAAFEVSQTDGQSQIQRAGFFKKKRHHGRGHRSRQFGHFGGYGFAKKHHGHGGFGRHHGRPFHGQQGHFDRHGQHHNGYHGGQGAAFFFGHGKGSYRY